MALSTSSTTNSLHQWSKASVQGQEGTTYTYSRTPPAPTFQTALYPGENPKIPSPSLFNFDVDSRTSSTKSRLLPTKAECATHLELLEAFHHLRLKIISSKSLDGALGVQVNRRTVFRKVSKGFGRWEQEEVKLRDETFDERRKLKWPFFLKLAAARFLKWVEVIEKEPEEPLLLPPIDILMVWHSLLLNPKWFLSLKYRKLAGYPFPWEEIHNSIDSDKHDWPSKVASRSQFLRQTKLHPDLLEELTADNKAPELKELLQKHDAGIIKSDVDEVLQKLNKLNYTDRLFLQCIQSAVSDNPVITQLVDAVTRQSAFVEKMDRQLWIRSPVLKGTLQRSIQRYSNFLKLFKMYPRRMLVPTLDIDLAWHTHQCSPAQYMEGTKSLAGRFIDHDDKLGNDKLDPGLENTTALYRVRFAEDYQYCHCWDCEALKSAVAEQETGETKDAEAIAKQVQTDVAYYRAVEIARRKGDTLLPVRS